MDWTVATYVAYVMVTVPLTVWVASELSRNGRVFLSDVFAGNDALATAVNKLLVVGFYLLTFGFVSLFLRIGGDVVDLRGLIEELSVKVGVVTLVLGATHFLNILIFNGMRRRNRVEQRLTHGAYGPQGHGPAPAQTWAPPYPG